MGTFKLTFLTCDRCGEEYDGMYPTAVEIREEAQRDGWEVNRHGGAFDVCPDCVKAIERDVDAVRRFAEAQ